MKEKLMPDAAPDRHRPHTFAHYTKRISLCAAALLLVSACATAREVKLPIARTSSERVKLQTVHAYQINGGIRIRGQVRRAGSGNGLGHVRITAMAATGARLAEVEARLPSLLGVRRRSGDFEAKMPIDDVTQVSSISVEVRTGPVGRHSTD